MGVTAAGILTGNTNLTKAAAISGALIETGKITINFVSKYLA